MRAFLSTHSSYAGALVVIGLSGSGRTYMFMESMDGYMVRPYFGYHGLGERSAGLKVEGWCRAL